MPPELALALRFVTAAILLAGYLAVRHGPRTLLVPWREIRGAAIIGSLLLGVAIGTLTLAERYVPSGVAALLVAINPLWIVIMRRATGDHPKLITWLGVIVGLSGVAVLVMPGDHVAALGGATATQRALWSLAIVCGSFCWSVGSFIQPKISTPRNPLVLAMYEMFAGAIVLALVGTFRGERIADFANASTRSWLALSYLVTFGSLLAFTVFVWLVTHAPLSLISTYAYVNPVVAVALGWWIKSEPITGGLIVGGAIVVGGVVLVVSGEWPARMHRQHQESDHSP
jgi:drug/metabolite transporter (DMT)-like permease